MIEVILIIVNAREAVWFYQYYMTFTKISLRCNMAIPKIKNKIL